MEEIQAVRDFVDIILKQIQFPDKKSAQTSPSANEEQFKVAA